jgi:NAD(P)-dependent dehydrogenase (short-subunit alcohol dehydrogenase family)
MIHLSFMGLLFREAVVNIPSDKAQKEFFMANGLKGQVAIVTGAGRGFGRAIAKRYAAEGAKVLVTARSKNQLDETVEQIHALGGEAIAVAGDVGNREDVSRVVSTAEERFGQVTLLVSNAGNSGPFGPIWFVDPDAWWDTQVVHVRGMLLYSRAVLPGMIKQKAGHIITVSAIAAIKVEQNMSAYAVAKSTQVRFTEHLAAEVREYGIAAFAIQPGTVFTDLAKGTIANPDTMRWRPGMVDRLSKLKEESDPAVGLEKCGEFCYRLASGQYDALSGHYIDIVEDLDEKLRKAMSPSGSG